MNRSVLAGFIAGAILASDASANEPGADVIKIAWAFSDGGGYVWRDGSGSPCTIEVEGATIVAAQKRGTYCSGFTFAVAMRAAAARGLLAGASTDRLRRFQKQWYGAAPDAAETQCALAVRVLGVGREIEGIENARPGDFVQLWRSNKSGHSVVLLELVHDDAGHVVGLHYRSSQSSTDGIGDRTEYFADAAGREGKLDRRRIYVARLLDEPR